MKLLPPPRDNVYDERAKFAVFAEACQILDDVDIPYVMGGGVAIRAYGRERPLKDADIFLEKRWVFPAMDELTRRGSFHTREMDATWLYKAIKDEILVDIIVRTTGNVVMNEKTYDHVRLVELYGHTFKMMGPEDLLFRKILSHREGRPDQFDALSMFNSPITGFDWNYFMELATANDYRKVLGFLLWMQSELDDQIEIPKRVICDLTDMVMSNYCQQETA